MFSTDDSIVAVATPPGRGGIGVVRISGPSAQQIAGLVLDRTVPLEPRHATFTTARGLDEVVATFFPAPHSYTGDDVVELSAHGSPVVLHAIVGRAIEAGARLAQPGEFTLRAYLNGKRDLVQAEAVADLIDAATPLQARMAFDQLEGTLTKRIAEIDAALFDVIARLEASLDFPDEGYHFIEPSEISRRVAQLVAALDALLAAARHGRMIREGATVVVAGRPNVGKSSIFNMLAGAERAIVTPIAGTTRDLVSERTDIDGLAVTLVDTAGWRETLDVVEREGVARGEQARAVADLLLLVVDSSEVLTMEDDQLLARTADRPRIVVANKSDLPSRAEMGRLEPAPTKEEEIVPARPVVGAGFRRLVCISAKTGAGLNDLRAAIVGALAGCEPLRDTAALSNVRHIALLGQARERLAAARAAAMERTSEEFVLADLQQARARFEEVVGVRTNDDLLQHIFERFCVGK